MERGKVREEGKYIVTWLHRIRHESWEGWTVQESVQETGKKCIINDKVCYDDAGANMQRTRSRPNYEGTGYVLECGTCVCKSVTVS